jgi:hypothetical protein
VLLELQAALLLEGTVKDRQRAAVFEAIAQSDRDLVDGCDEFLQLLKVGSIIQRTMAVR